MSYFQEKDETSFFCITNLSEFKLNGDHGLDLV